MTCDLSGDLRFSVCDLSGDLSSRCMTCDLSDDLRFSVCDLAGSERVEKTLAAGARMKEAGNINSSLMVLGRCMKAMR